MQQPEVTATIYVEPVAKGRPRMAVINGHPIAYTPKKTRQSEQMIQAMVRTQLMQYGKFGDDAPIKLEATFYRERPRSLSKKMTMPVTRPDWDNYAKLLTDSLQHYVFRDDAQITTALIRKRFGSPPRIEISITIDCDQGYQAEGLELTDNTHEAGAEAMLEALKKEAQIKGEFINYRTIDGQLKRGYTFWFDEETT